MEFVQFHPTGMVWPPSVMGILVTEGVRGEGGILRNKDGKRFMFGDIPDNYKAQTADNEEEGWRYCQGDKNARRPPELLTRDHVARCIVREIKEGRGSPHGGVFLDIAWIKEKTRELRRTHPAQAAEHVSSVQTTGGHRHHAGADGSRPDDALRHGRHPREFGHADVECARTVCRGRMRGRHQRRKPARRQFALGHYRFWKARRRIRGEVRGGKQRRGIDAASRKRPAKRSNHSSAARQGGKSVSGAAAICRR